MAPFGLLVDVTHIVSLMIILLKIGEMLLTKGHNFIIALTGKSGAGKDAVAHELCKRFDMEFVVSTTSRPMRSNEEEGREYHFTSPEEFQELIDSDALVEHRRYYTIQRSQPQVWDYGIKKSDICLDSNSYVCIVDLEGLESLEKVYGNQVISVYIDTNDEIRFERAKKRDSNFDLDEFARRLADDFVKFKDVRGTVTIVADNNGELKDCVDAIAFQVDYAMQLVTFYEQYASY